MPRYIDELNDIGGLSGIDIANIADVSKATVSRWKSGSVKPQPNTQLVLSDLHDFVGWLSEYFAAQQIRIWLIALHPQPDNERPVDLINSNRSVEVLCILDRLDADVFLSKYPVAEPATAGCWMRSKFFLLCRIPASPAGRRRRPRSAAT